MTDRALYVSFTPAGLCIDCPLPLESMDCYYGVCL